MATVKPRPSPSDSATLFDVGHKRKGNDGGVYIVMVTKAGVKRWAPFKKGCLKKGGPALGPRTKSYLTHDNGGRAFLVKYDSKAFEVYAKKNGKCEDEIFDRPEPTLLQSIFGKRNDVVPELKKCFTELIYSSPYKRVFVGRSRTEGASGRAFEGNSMLFEIPEGRYVYIGIDVVSFKALPGDEITRYDSPIYSSDVPVPRATGAVGSYLLGFESSVVLLADLPTRNTDPFEYMDQPGVRLAFKKLPSLKVIKKRR